MLIGLNEIIFFILSVALIVIGIMMIAHWDNKRRKNFDEDEFPLVWGGMCTIIIGSLGIFMSILYLIINLF